MPIDPDATIEITAFEWVPPFAQGFVRDLRPRWACEEIGLAYRERLISAVDRPEWYYAEQPWGQVPHLREGEIAMFESGATLVHLGEKGGLLPKDGQPRATVLSWLFAAYNSVEPAMFEIANATIFARKQDWAPLRLPSLLEDTGKRLDRLAAALGDSEWIAGDFSIADIAMVTVLRDIDRTELVAERPGLRDYVERGKARPAFKQALADQMRHFEANAPKQTAGA
ncbi:glutathione S-transferase [Novosphingobium sp. PC22D]|uniref:glutathione S-transferase family protein n=1 Tax=Novosphingobium sp. PC22D TaxID=1962403 RepID=UPI000BEF67E6|nr:glutathione S-transferase family protein [Novosphingobium sp. PC22D]PEQ13275.1 glutathione S-transferase [Novosphingobium sp. PC22D]